MHVGIGEGDPAIDLRTAARGAIAGQTGERRDVGDVVEDGRVLGQCPVVDKQQRHGTGRVEAQILGGLHRGGVDHLQIER